jgi:hypothetical protein
VHTQRLKMAPISQVLYGHLHEEHERNSHMITHGLG